MIPVKTSFLQNTRPPVAANLIEEGASEKEVIRVVARAWRKQTHCTKSQARVFAESLLPTVREYLVEDEV